MSVVRGYKDLFGPRFFLEANGSLATDLIPYISKVEYEDHDTKVDQLKLTVLNPGLKFKDDPRFKEGAKFRFRFGYLSDISDVKLASISKAKPSYPQNGIPTIEMVAFGLQQTVNKQANPFNWGAVSSSDVARKIAERYGFQVDIEESKDSRSQMRIQPANLSDMQFVKSLAAKLNWDCYLEGTTLHFHHKRFEKPADLEFIYFTDGTGTLLSFSPEVNMNAAPDTKAAGNNTRDGKSTADGQTDSGGRMVNTRTAYVGPMTSQAGGPSSPNGEGITHPSHETDPKVIAAHGAAKAQKIDMKAVKAKAEVIGTPRARARIMVRISGVDQQYTGNWRVAGSKHTFEPKGVYKCSLDMKRDAGKANAKSENEKGAGEGVAPVTVNTRSGFVSGFTP